MDLFGVYNVWRFISVIYISQWILFRLDLRVVGSLPQVFSTIFFACTDFEMLHSMRIVGVEAI